MEDNDLAVIGMDVGGTNTEIGLVDRHGNGLGRRLLRTDQYADFEVYTQAVVSAIQELTLVRPIRAVGIGAPNGNYFNGAIDHAPNLRWEGVLPFADMLSHKLKVPAVLTNDANAAAIGEMYYGGAQGLKNFMVVTIGTGLGSGIVVNGEVLYGHSGFAGEMGHTAIRPGGRPCTCGKAGCLEAYVSARGLIANAGGLMAGQDWDTEFASEADLVPPIRICEAAKRGDQLAIESFRLTGEYLGEHLADMAALFSPEAVFLFGGLTKAGNLLLEPTRESFTKHLLPILQGSVRLELSSLSETNAGIVGAAALAWNEIN